MRHLKMDEYDEHERHICSFEVIGGMIYTQQYYRPNPLPKVSSLTLPIPIIKYNIYLNEDDFKNNICKDSFNRCTPFYNKKLIRKKWIEENPNWVYCEVLKKYFNNQDDLDVELKDFYDDIMSDEEYKNRDDDRDDLDEDYFNAMTDGQQGNYNDNREDF